MVKIFFYIARSNHLVYQIVPTLNNEMITSIYLIVSVNNAASTTSIHNQRTGDGGNDGAASVFSLHGVP